MQTKPNRVRWRSLFTRQRVGRVAMLLAVIGLSVYIYSIRDRAEQLAQYGYAGVFVLAFLSYATVILPAPGIAVVFTMGSVFDPLGVALAAGAGATLGEVSGYLAGYSGRAVFERSDVYTRLTDFMRRKGPWAIIALSAVPNPFFDLAGAAAGALRMPFTRFLFWCWIGETLKMLFFAYAGAGVLGWLGI
ncbi:MAG: VTT domain-containing protein [Chloroflexota bacterium]